MNSSYSSNSENFCLFSALQSTFFKSDAIIIFQWTQPRFYNFKLSDSDLEPARYMQFGSAGGSLNRITAVTVET